MPMHRIVIMLGAFAGVLLNLTAATADEQTLREVVDQKIQPSLPIVDLHGATAKSAKVRREGVRLRRSRAHADARICLDAGNRAAIIRCAEKYR